MVITIGEFLGWIVYSFGVVMGLMELRADSKRDL